MSLDDDLEKLATAVISDWPEIALSGRLDAAIRDLYRAHLSFPQSWTLDECEEFVEEQADTDAQRLAIQFDDAIDVALDDFRPAERVLAPRRGRVSDDRRSTKRRRLRVGGQHRPSGR